MNHAMQICLLPLLEYINLIRIEIFVFCIYSCILYTKNSAWHIAGTQYLLNK